MTPRIKGAAQESEKAKHMNDVDRVRNESAVLGVGLI